MRDPEESPLKEEERKKFTELNFFPVDSNFRVTAKFTRLKKQKSFEMKTSGSKRPLYIVYGIVEFTLGGKVFKLNVYRNIVLSKEKEYRNYLFLPFTDNTNGGETYGGGRYIDLKIPKGNVIVIDFNLCYNPYCAYTTGYSCPVPPAENYIDYEISAGEKLLWDTH